MEDVIIASGVRTAIGRFQGSLSDVPASDLGAHVIREAVSRAGIEPERVDQVIMGIVGQVAEDAYLSRHAAVKAGLPIGTPAMNVNRICGSGLEAINTDEMRDLVEEAWSRAVPLYVAQEYGRTKGYD